MEIKEATVNMCRRIAEVKYEVWTTTYRDIYPEYKFKNFNFDTETKKFESLIFNPNVNLFVGTENNKIIGYMAVGKSDRPFDDNLKEIILLYVLKDYQKMGFGKQFFNYAYNLLKLQGEKEFIISCNKFNKNALAFYEKMGGKIIHIDEDFEDKSLSQIKLLFSVQ